MPSVAASRRNQPLAVAAREKSALRKARTVMYAYEQLGASSAEISKWFGIQPKYVHIFKSRSKQRVRATELQNLPAEVSTPETERF
jgi:hypothetical protein